MTQSSISRIDNYNLNKIRKQLNDQFIQYGIPIKVAITQAQMAAVTSFVNDIYLEQFPALDSSHGEVYRRNSLNLYSTDNNGKICASMRMIIDTDEGLPEEYYFKQTLAPLRQNGSKILQIGRFATVGNRMTRTLINDYVQLPYLVPYVLGYDAVVGMVRQSDVDLYVKRYGAELICRDTGETYGGKQELSTLIWRLADMRPNFVKKPQKAA